MSDIFRGLGVEVDLITPEKFLLVKETLTRIGVPSRKDNTLFQSVHIFHKQGRYVIIHFKELFVMDGKPSDVSENDLQRRNTVAKLLADWGMVKLIDPKGFDEKDLAPLHQIRIIQHKDVPNWTLVAKYNIGKKVYV